MREYILQEGNERLEKYLKRILPNASTGFLYKMLRKKNILLNDKKATGKEILKTGDRINIFFSEDTFLKFEGKDSLERVYESLSQIQYKDLTVVYEDDEKIIINKPFGILSQKSTKEDISINEIILSYLINNGLSFEEFLNYKPSVLNRLDRNTGGLILAAKTRTCAVTLSENIKNKSIRRIYNAVVHGTPDFDGTFYLKYTKDEEKNLAKILPIEADYGEEISTSFNTLKKNADRDISLISCELHTGKSHQIRAVTGYLGCPVINDKKYGSSKKDNELFKKAKSKLPGQYLFAKEILFPEGLEVKTGIPGAFSELF